MVVTFIAGLMIGIALMAVIGVTFKDREFRAAARRGRRSVRRRRRLAAAPVQRTPRGTA